VNDQDKKVIPINTGYIPDPDLKLIRSAELQEIQSTLIHLADEVVGLSRAIQALVGYLKSSRNKP
jgi:hypothetical protein